MSDPASPSEAVRPAVDLLDQPVFRREFTPTWLSTAAAMAGAPPLDPSRPLRFADLACRSGVQAAVVAACHPDAEVWAVDHETTNVERAQRLGHDARLDNLTVVEWRTQRDAGRLPEELDIVVLDDVISTVDAARRADLAEFITRRVRPGGLVALSYRTLCGWAEIVALHRLATLVAGSGRRPTGDRVDAVAAALRRLRDGGATFIRDRRAVSSAVDAVLEGGIDSLERFLLTDHLEPLSLGRVANWLRPTGSIYVGSLRLDTQPEPGSPLSELLADTAEQHLREMLRDIATQPAYRIDLFRRGSSPMTATARRAHLGSLELILLVEGLDAATTGSATLDRLGRGPATVDDLLQGGRTDGDVDALLQGLLGQGIAHPRSIGWATTDASEPCRALNAVLACNASPERPPVRAIPAIGSAVDE